MKLQSIGRVRQAGMTLLEVLLGLSILAIGTVGLSQLADTFGDDAQGAVAAGQLRTFGEASKSYIKDNYAAVQALATPTVPAIIDAATLIAAGKLPAGYVNTNSFGQATCVLVLEPTANRLQALVVTEGGTAQGDSALGSIAGLVGGSGGGIYSTATGTIRGAVGGWSVPVADFDNKVNNLARKCDGTSGNVRVQEGHSVMALWFENGDVSSAFVARDAVPGRPELNAMNTPLVMNSVQTAGAACTTTGAIAQDGAGGIVSCQGGTWKASGDGKCVLTTSDLNNLQTDGRCYNGAALPNSPAGGDWAFIEVYRHPNLGVWYTTQRVIGMTGAAVGKSWVRTQQSASAGGGWGSWTQYADPQVSVASGSVAAAGSLTAGNNVTAAGTAQGAYVYSTGTVRAAADVQAGTYMYAGLNVTAGQDVNATRNLGAGQHLSAGGSAFVGQDVIAQRDVQAIGNLISGATTYNASDSWSFMGFGAGYDYNAQPQAGRGSMHINDIYVRSIGKWVSQMNNAYATPFYHYVGDGGACPAGSVAVGAGGFYHTYTAGYLYCAYP